MPADGTRSGRAGWAGEAPGRWVAGAAAPDAACVRCRADARRGRGNLRGGCAPGVRPRRVGVGRLDWRADHANALGPEDFLEGGAELLVAVVDDAPERVLVAERTARLCACCVTHRPSGFEVQAMYSIRRVEVVSSAGSYSSAPGRAQSQFLPVPDPSRRTCGGRTGQVCAAWHPDRCAG